MTCTESFKFEFKKDQIKCIYCNFILFQMITALWRLHVEQFCRILLAFPETCVLFCFVFEIFQNQSAAGNVIQLNKKDKPNLSFGKPKLTDSNKSCWIQCWGISVSYMVSRLVDTVSRLVDTDSRLVQSPTGLNTTDSLSVRNNCSFTSKRFIIVWDTSELLMDRCNG